MISQESGFKLLDRGFEKTLVLIPGWATDYRIFSPLDLDYNYLLPVKFNPFDFVKGLSVELERMPEKKVSLFGWSQGGFLASEFVFKFPEKINELFLLSICRRFDPVVLEGIRQKITKNREAYLYKFYLDCFKCGGMVVFRWFKKHLLKDYIKIMDLESLIRGLDYLLQVSIEAESLKKVSNVRIFHGEKDRIVTFESAEDFGKSLGTIKLTFLPEAGHAIFLNPGFKQIFENGPRPS